MFWFVVPVGAMGAGFVAAGGYFFGAKFFGHRPSGQIFFNMVAVSIGTFFLIHYVEYFLFTIEGQPIRNFVSYWQYLSISLEHTSLTFNVRGADLGATGELGAWGYGYASLQVIGFALGGLIIFGHLSEQPYCDTCSKYMYERDKLSRYTADPEALKDIVALIIGNFDSGQLGEAVKNHMSFGLPSASKETNLCLVKELHECPSCSVQRLLMKAMVYSGNAWKDIGKVRFLQFKKPPL